MNFTQEQLDAIQAGWQRKLDDRMFLRKALLYGRLEKVIWIILINEQIS